MKTPGSREPFLIVLVLALAAFGFGEYVQSNELSRARLALLETMQNNMHPAIQRSDVLPAADYLRLAGKGCSSDGCREELRGWQWAVRNGVARQGDCYGENSAYTLGISKGCDIYSEVMQMPKIPEN